MSKPTPPQMVHDIRGFFGGAKAAVVVPVGKSGKKTKKEGDDALAAGEADGAGKADGSEQAASGVKRKRPSDAAAVSVDATARASPSRKGSASREALPAAAKPASASRAAPAAAAAADDGDNDDDDLVVAAKRKRKPEGSIGAAAGAGVKDVAVTEGDDAEDAEFDGGSGAGGGAVSINELRQREAHAAAAVKAKAVEEAAARRAASAAAAAEKAARERPVVVALDAHAVAAETDAAAFFGGATVAKGSTAAAVPQGASASSPGRGGKAATAAASSASKGKAKGRKGSAAPAGVNSASVASAMQLDPPNAAAAGAAGEEDDMAGIDFDALEAEAVASVAAAAAASASSASAASSRTAVAAPPAASASFRAPTPAHPAPAAPAAAAAAPGGEGGAGGGHSLASLALQTASPTIGAGGGAHSASHDAAAGAAATAAKGGVTLLSGDSDDDAPVMMGRVSAAAAAAAASAVASAAAASAVASAAAAAAKPKPSAAAAASGTGAAPLPKPKPSLPAAHGSVGMDASKPLFHQSLAPPKGKPGCLAGTKWVITGELERMTRDVAVGVIKAHGGEVVSAMSGRVTHLLTGSKLEDGRPVTAGQKWQAAQATQGRDDKRAVAILCEDEWYELMEDTLPPQQRDRARAARCGGSSSSSSAAPAVEAVSASAGAADTDAGVASPSAAAASAPSASAAASSSSALVALPPLSRAAAACATSAGGGRFREEQLWVDKYAPADFGDLVGNRKEVDAIDGWLRRWESVHLRGERVAGSKENPGARAVLISGPPGVGKTTCALLLARRHRYEPYELNASDARSKRKLDEVLGGGALSSGVLHFQTKQAAGGDAGSAAAASSSSSSAAASSGSGSGGSSGFTRRLVIMDEVDGLSTADRGGNAELAKLIRTSRVPIVCICNDRQKPAVRTLVKYCYDVKFHAPTMREVQERLAAIAARERLAVEPDALAQLVESVGGDLRQALNTLQMWAVTHRALTAGGMRDRMAAVCKDMNLRLDAFSAAPKLFDLKGFSAEQRYELFFVDYDLIPLLVQQAYPGVLDKAGFPDAVKLQRLARAAEAVSDADVYQEYVRKKQAWGMLPAIAVGNVRACGYAAGPAPFLQFPTWLGKNSTRGKRARLLAELGLHMAAHVSGGREALRLDYLSPLRARLFAPLVAASRAGGGGELAEAAAGEVSALLDEYNLTREDMVSTMGEELTFKVDLPGGGGGGGGEFTDWMKATDSKVKAAFTRAYNKAGHHTQVYGGLAPGMAASFKKSKKKAAGGGGGSGGLGAAAGAVDGQEVSDAEDAGALVADEDLEAADGGADGDNDDDEEAEEVNLLRAGRGRGGRGRGRGRGAAKGGRGAAKGAAAAAPKSRGGGSGGAAARGGGAASASGSASSSSSRGGKAAIPKRAPASSDEDEAGADESNDDDVGFVDDSDDE